MVFLKVFFGVLFTIFIGYIADIRIKKPYFAQLLASCLEVGSFLCLLVSGLIFEDVNQGRYEGKNVLQKRLFSLLVFAGCKVRTVV